MVHKVLDEWKMKKIKAQFPETIDFFWVPGLPLVVLWQAVHNTGGKREEEGKGERKRRERVREKMKENKKRKNRTRKWKKNHRKKNEKK